MSKPEDWFDKSVQNKQESKLTAAFEQKKEDESKEGQTPADDAKKEVKTDDANSEQAEFDIE